MTHREYQRCAANYTRLNNPSPERKQQVVDYDIPSDPNFKPDFKPMDMATMAKLVWAGRLGIKDKVP